MPYNTISTLPINADTALKYWSVMSGGAAADTVPDQNSIGVLAHPALKDDAGTPYLSFMFSPQPVEVAGAYATKAAMDADLSPATATVVNCFDPDPVKRGRYVKDGAANAGVWVRNGDVADKPWVDYNHPSRLLELLACTMVKTDSNAFFMGAQQSLEGPIGGDWRNARIILTVRAIDMHLGPMSKIGLNVQGNVPRVSERLTQRYGRPVAMLANFINTHSLISDALGFGRESWGAPNSVPFVSDSGLVDVVVDLTLDDRDWECLGDPGRDPATKDIVYGSAPLSEVLSNWVGNAYIVAHHDNPRDGADFWHTTSADYVDDFNRVRGELRLYGVRVEIDPELTSLPSTLSISGPTAVAEGGTASFTATRGGGTTGTTTVGWSVTGYGAQPAVGASFTGGALPSGTLSFATGETSKTITIATAQNTADEPDKAFTVTLSNPVGGVLGTPASVTTTITDDDVVQAPTGTEIWLDMGDSYKTGIYTRSAGDTDWTNTFQVRVRDGADYLTITSDTTPLYHWNPNVVLANNYLSEAEYFAKERAVATGKRVVSVPLGWNGAKVTDTSQGWGPGGYIHEGAITRANAAIAAVKDLYPDAVVAGVSWWGGANDGQVSGMTQGVFRAALDAMFASFRTRITDMQNGTILLGGMLPEWLNYSVADIRASRWGVELALRAAAAELPGVYYTPLPAGHNTGAEPGSPGDFLHPGNSGVRAMGQLKVQTLADVTAPTFTVADINANAGETLNVELTGAQVYHWSLTGPNAAQFTVVNETSSTGVRHYLRTANEAPLVAGTYALTINGHDGADNVASDPITVTVAGAQQPTGPVTPTPVFQERWNGGNAGDGVGDVTYTHNRTVQWGAGVNALYFKASELMLGIVSISVGGTVANLTHPSFSHAGTNDKIGLLTFEKATAGSGDLTIAYKGQAGNLVAAIVALGNANPVPTQVKMRDPIMGYVSPGSPAGVAAMVVPADGVAIAMAEARDGAGNAGVTYHANPGPGAGSTQVRFLSRATDGDILLDPVSGGSVPMIAASFAKAS